MKLHTKRVQVGLLTLIISATFSLPSCKKDFLEVTPKGRLLLSKTSDYNLALNTLDLVNVNADAQIPLSDETAGLSSYFNPAALRTQRLFRWEDDVYQPGETAPELTVPMRNIYLYNTIINGVMSSTGGTDAEKRSILAEALAGRAWVYFLLINYYGKPYREASAATDPGVPIVTDGDVTQTVFERASVKVVYGLIVNDLTKAIPDLPKAPFWRLRMSRSAGEALLAKVNIFMGKYNEAIPLLNSAFDNLTNATITIRLYNYNNDLRPGGALALQANGYPSLVTVVNNLEFIYGRQIVNRWASTTSATAYEVLLHPSVFALYGARDLRTTFLSDKLPTNATMPAGLRVRKYPAIVNIGMSLSEMYLLRAEAKARTNDLSGAVSDLQTLRNNRMPTSEAVVPTSIANNRLSLVRFVFDERSREFALMGYRWFDMRRLSVDSEFGSLVGNTHVLYTDAGAIQATYTLKPERLVLRYPELVMSQNPGWVNNP